MIRLGYFRDNYFLSSAVRCMMEDERSFEFVFEENVHCELFYKLSRYMIDLLLIINEYEIDFHSLITRISELYPELPVVIVCCDDNVQKAKELERLGAKVFIRKFTALDFIEILKSYAQPNVLRNRREDQKEISLSVMQNQINISTLKKNHRQILSMLSKGEERKRIAEQCNLSLNTVNKYIQTIKVNYKFSSVNQMVSAYKQEMFETTEGDKDISRRHWNN